MNAARHIISPSDLITPHEEIRAGFLKLGLEKNRVATPYVEQAKALRNLASRVASPQELHGLTDIRPSLLTAAGVSDKAVRHLNNDIGDAIITKLIETFLEPAGKDFVDELVFRFLLTRGDSLGGRMRNLGGQMAQHQFIRALVANLIVKDVPFQWLDHKSNLWLEGAKDDAGIELQAKGVRWRVNEEPRTLLLNMKVSWVNKNVDLTLLNTTYEASSIKQRFFALPKDPMSYIALGELKGGIDPAGADEHWKTANSALARIRTSSQLVGHRPHLFLILAAIAKSMAEEIFSQLENGDLSFAANLTNDKQVYDVCDWLVNL